MRKTVSHDFPNLDRLVCCFKKAKPAKPESFTPVSSDLVPQELPAFLG